MDAFSPDSSEDACSICLEPFSADDPATVTNCNHEYHLQCILEWSQRSRECPICWQLLVLMDPACQELLATVEVERSSRTRRRYSDAPASSRMPSEDIEFHNVPTYAEDLDFDEHIMQHLAAAAMGRSPHFSRRERHNRSTGLDRSQFFFTSSSDESDVQQTHTTSPTETQSLGGSASPVEDSPHTPSTPPNIDELPLELSTSSPTSLRSDFADNRHGCPSSPSQTLPSSPQRSRQSEIFSFSESLRSKLSAASSRYKESISKSTRGFKEKLLARNNSVKELSKEVQREVTAGVSRLMERLDPASKRTGGVSSTSNGGEGTSELSHNGNNLQEELIAHAPEGCGGGAAQLTNSNASVHVPDTLYSTPGLVAVAHKQD